MKMRLIILLTCLAVTAPQAFRIAFRTSHFQDTPAGGDPTGTPWFTETFEGPGFVESGWTITEDPNNIIDPSNAVQSAFGSYSCYLDGPNNTSEPNAYVSRLFPSATTNTNYYGQFYVWSGDGSPIGDDVEFWNGGWTNPASQLGVKFTVQADVVTSNHHITAHVVAGDEQEVNISSDAWHRVDYHLDVGAKSMEWKLDGVDKTTLTTTFVPKNLVRLGFGHSRANITYFDHIRIATDDWLAEPFSPSDVTNMVAWFDAGLGVTTNDSEVTLWEDQSGTNDLSQATPNKMPLHDSSDAAFNNEASVTFDGGDEVIETVAFASALSQPNTIFMVARHTVINVSNWDILYDGIANSGERHTFAKNTSDNWEMYAGTTQIDGAANTNVHVFGIQYNTTSGATYIDGGTADISGDVGSETMGGLLLGALWDESLHASVAIAEFVIYDALLTDAEMNDVGNYLATKYGTTWNTIGFAPSDVTNMVAWFDADATYITTNDAADRVSTWADRYGTNDLTQTTGSDQPLWSSSDADFNGQPSVLFDDTNDFLVTAGFGGGDLSQPNTVFMVAKWDVGNDAYFFDGLTSTKRHVFWSNGSENFEVFAGSSIVDGARDANVHVFGIQFDTTSGDLYIDGGAASVSGDVGSQVWDGLTMGARYSQDGELGMTCTEFIIYDALLTDAEMNQIGNYLATKYGTTWTDL